MKRNRGGREVLPVQAIVPVYFTSLHGSGQVLRLCQDLGLNSQLTHTHTRTHTDHREIQLQVDSEPVKTCVRALITMEYIFK